MTQLKDRMNELHYSNVPVKSNIRCSRSFVRCLLMEAYGTGDKRRLVQNQSW
jgi:hypothetical protein